MKKTYISPAIKAVSVRTGRLMEGSIDVNVNDTPYTGGDSGIGAKEDEDFDW